ncbi:hypothetical protein GCM10009642_63480 [Nocardiopsis metallicus]
MGGSWHGRVGVRLPLGWEGVAADGFGHLGDGVGVVWCCTRRDTHLGFSWCFLPPGVVDDLAHIRRFMGFLLGPVKNVMNLSSYGGARDTQ